MELTLSDVEEIYGQLADDYTTLRTKQAKWKELFDRSFSTYLTVNAFDHIVRPDSAQQIIETPISFLALDTLLVKQRPKSSKGGKKVGEEADDIEKALQSLVNKWVDMPPYFKRENLFDLCLMGESIYRVTVAQPVVDQDAEYKGLPFFLDVLDPLSVMASLNMDEYGCPEIVFWTRLLPIYTIQRLVAQNNAKDIPPVNFANYTAKDKLLYVEWWTPEYRGYMAGPKGELPTSTGTNWKRLPFLGDERYPNPYGFVPYTRGFTGLGRMPSDGIQASVCRSLLDGIEDVIVQEARFETRMDTITAFNAFTEETVTLADDAIHLSDEEMLRRPGVPRRNTPTRKWESRNPPPIPPALLQHGERIQARIAARIPSVSRGERSPGEPAISQSNRFDWGTQSWQPLQISANHMLANALVLVLKTIEKMDLSVEIGGQVLKKDLIKGHYAIEVSTKSGNPEEGRYKVLQGADLWQRKAYTRRGIVEKYYEVENADEFLKELYSDNLVETILANLNSVAAQPLVQMLMSLLQLKLQAKGYLPPAPSLPASEGSSQEGTPPSGIGRTEPEAEGVTMPGGGGSPSRGVVGLAAPIGPPQ